ncbi:Uma2 family endonuclease [Candidatus Poribacteria bacterium]|nr:Uma2 family endonuclease [Candidatus Poribacteria bacterium]
MQKQIQAAPTIIYPESDGEPMAETDRHRNLMMDFIFLLKEHFEDVNDVYVSGNLLMYYEEGNIYKSVAPDVFVVFGVSKKERRTYRTWEEAHTPDFVLEVASPSTYTNDITDKKALYADVLSVQEYYIYDPYGEVHPHFQGYRLVDGVYQEIAFVDERLPSVVLGLELGERDGILSLYDANHSAWVPPPKVRVLEAEARVENAEARAAQAAEARAHAEKELAKALAVIEQLKEKTQD